MSDATPPPAGEPARPQLGPQVWAVLLLSLLLSGAAAWYVLRDAVLAPPPPKPRPQDWSDWTVPLDAVVAATTRHALPPLEEPDALTADEAADFKVGRRGKFLVEGDLVVGVVTGGEACAYPVRILEWHEAIWREQGGVPLAVTYHPLSGCAAVFDRRPGKGAEPLRLRASGLLWQSTLLLVDAAPPDAPEGYGESLWSQVLGRAVAGPAAMRAATLRQVPCQLTHWGDWSARHPDTRVIVPDPTRTKALKRSPYGSYLGNDLLRFPVDPAPPSGAGALKNKARVLAVTAGSEQRVFPYRSIEQRAASGPWQTRLGEATLRFRWLPSPNPPFPPAATVTVEAGEAEVVPCFWFAWYATHGGEVRLAD